MVEGATEEPPKVRFSDLLEDSVETERGFPIRQRRRRRERAVDRMLNMQVVDFVCYMYICDCNGDRVTIVQKKEHAIRAFQAFLRDFGIPSKIHYDK